MTEDIYRPFDAPAGSHDTRRVPESGTKTDMLGYSAATNNQTGEGVAIKKVTNVFSKKILAKRALREIKLLQHFRGHRNVCHPVRWPIDDLGLR